ncbi:MAG: hypothetical protein ACJAT2_003811 [Bacteriovoracaceae bacterium]|jgi:hypothetical protein
MIIDEYIFIGIGACFSIIGYFLKRENKRLEGMEKLINEINVTLAKNEVRDFERYNSIEKALEDRRVDVRKIFDIIQQNKK